MSLSYDFVNISLCGVRKTWITILLIIVGLALGVHCITPSISPPQKRAGPSETFKDHCNKTVDIYEDVASPEVTNQNRGRPMTCWYRFRSFRGAPRDWVLRLRFKKFKVGSLVNATYCEGGFLQIVDGNAKTDVSNRREPGMFCGEAEQPQTFISETSYVKILFHADNFTDQTYFSFDSRAEQQMEVYLRYGQHPELYPNRRGEIVQGSYCEREFRDCRLQTCYVQSPAYPGLYPRALNCRYRLHTRQPFIKLYLQNEHFSVDGQSLKQSSESSTTEMENILEAIISNSRALQSIAEMLAVSHHNSHGGGRGSSGRNRGGSSGRNCGGNSGENRGGNSKIF